jgi:hypothetical protein
MEKENPSDSCMYCFYFKNNLQIVSGYIYGHCCYTKGRVWVRHYCKHFINNNGEEY